MSLSSVNWQQFYSDDENVFKMFGGWFLKEGDRYRRIPDMQIIEMDPVRESDKERWAREKERIYFFQILVPDDSTTFESMEFDEEWEEEPENPDRFYSKDSKKDPEGSKENPIIIN